MPPSGRKAGEKKHKIAVYLDGETKKIYDDLTDKSVAISVALRMLKEDKRYGFFFKKGVQVVEVADELDDKNDIKFAEKVEDSGGKVEEKTAPKAPNGHYIEKGWD